MTPELINNILLENEIKINPKSMRKKTRNNDVRRPLDDKKYIKINTNREAHPDYPAWRDKKNKKPFYGSREPVKRIISMIHGLDGSSNHDAHMRCKIGNKLFWLRHSFNRKYVQKTLALRVPSDHLI